jgi:RNA polymerase sigma factor (sigma-70 family)
METAGERVGRMEADEVELPSVIEFRLRQMLVARYGWELGIDAWLEVVAYAWQHRERLSGMENPTGYLYRVGQSEVRRLRRRERRGRRVEFPAPEPNELPETEPGLADALAALSERQRTAVMLVHAHGWTHDEAAKALGVSTSTLRNHLARGLVRLREQLGVDDA